MKYVLLFLSTSVTGFAQNFDADSVLYTSIKRPSTKQVEVTSRHIEYFFNIQSGSLIGCNDCGKGQEVTFSLATTHGITVGKKFRAGLGVGFDTYTNWQTLPISALASWDLIGNKDENALFLQVYYGWAHPWFIRNASNQYYSDDPYSGVSGGKMINPGIGYRISYYNLRLAFTVGYKFQRIFYKTNQNGYVCPQCNYYAPFQTSEITQDLNRVQLMMSVGWK